MPRSPPTSEQLQQTRHLAEAGSSELEQVTETLESLRRPAVTNGRRRAPLGPDATFCFGKSRIRDVYRG